MSQEAIVKRDYYRGERCEVARDRGDGVVAWNGGKVVDLTGNGAFVLLDKGPRNFFHWKDIRPEPKPELPLKPGPRALATIGDAVGLRRPILTTTAAQPAAAKALAPATALPSKPARAIHRHHPTAIGDAFRALRLREGVTQEVIAKLLGISNSFWSKIELGGANPSDDLLERFAALSGDSLETLRAKRDGRAAALTATPPLAALASTEPPPLPAQAAPEPIEAPQPAPPRDGFDGFEDFVDRLVEVAPMPVNRETRRRWFQLARDLFDLARSE